MLYRKTSLSESNVYANLMVLYIVGQQNQFKRSLLNYWHISKNKIHLHHKFYQSSMYVKSPDLLELEESPLAHAQHYTVIPLPPNIQQH